MRLHSRLLPVAIAPLVVASLFPSIASAAVTWTGSWNLSAGIPDGDPVGYSDTRTASFSPGMFISKVTVSLNFSGGWNGDLYAYLTNGSGFAVLLNPPGRDSGAEDGSSTSGMTVTFDDDATSDLHSLSDLQVGGVDGTRQPDARNVNPYTVVTGDVRTAFLSSLNGEDPTTPFTLFVADLSAGEASTLDSWSLVVTAVSPIPEPGSHLALAGIVAGGLVLRRRNSRRSRP
jgi:subtilisin-like proprotein convertase family protein